MKLPRTAIVAAAVLCAAPALANTCVPLQAGSTDQTVYVEFIDATTGAPTSGLLFNSSGIDLEYVRSGANPVDITEVTQTANGAHTDGGFVSVGHGRYRLDLPDAAVAAGVPQVVIQGTITGYIMLPCVVALSPPANVVAFGGSAGTFASGIPAVNTTQVSGDSAVADRLEAILDFTCGSYPELGILRGVGCTAQSYSSETPSLTIDSPAAFGDNTLTGATIVICGSTQGYCQAAIAASNVGSTDVVTLAEALPVTPTGTITYTIYGTAPGAASDVNVAFIEGADPTDTILAALVDDNVRLDASELNSLADTLASLNDIDANDLRDLMIEDQGGGVSLGCALAVLLAYAAGDVVTSDGASTYEDPSGSETRITGTVSSGGNRTASITCPSY